MKRTSPRARRASRKRTASHGADSRRRDTSRPARKSGGGFLLLTLFSLLACSSPRPAFGELGVAGHDLSNFQGKHACGSDLRMSAPETVADVARVVAAFPKVRAVGVGHSWNKQLFCAGDGRDAADVVLRKVRAVGRSVTGDKTPRLASHTSTSRSSRSLLGGSGAPDEDPRFEVDAAAATVSADAGATVRELLDFLRDFRPSRIGANDEDEDASEDASEDDRSSTSSRSALDVLRRLRRNGGETNEAGYTLPAFPWFVDQTVGGAVATATHGSSLRHGSLSSQVVSLTVALANGTVCELSERNNEPNSKVFDAARAGLGRFGVVVRVRLRIQKNTPVRRTARETSPEAFALLVAKASDAFAKCVDAIDANADDVAQEKETQLVTLEEKRQACVLASPHVRRLDETQAFWFFPLGKISLVTFARLDDLEDEMRVSEPTTAGWSSETPSQDANDKNDEMTGDDESDDAAHASTQKYSDVSISVAASVVAATRTPHAVSVRLLEETNLVFDQPPDAPRLTTEVWPALGNDTFARFWSRQWERSTLENVQSGVFQARDSYLTMTETQYDAHDHFAYDQYETCVPMRLAGKCLDAINKSARDEATGDVGGTAFGFRSQGLIRFVNEENALLSPSNGNAAGACMYVNLEDFVEYNKVDGVLDVTKEKKKKNEAFQRVVRLLRSETCQGRLHWGKAGWPDDSSCFDGSKEYGESWCAFACAAFSVDPSDKFVPADSVFERFHDSSRFNRERCCDAASGEYRKEEPGCACAAFGETLVGGSCGEAWY